MEKIYIKSRIDCPPPEARQLIKEKDVIIQKQQMQIKELEANLTRLKFERNLLHDSLNQIIMNNFRCNPKKSSNCQVLLTPPSSSSSSLSLQSPSSSMPDNQISRNEDKLDLEQLKAISILSNSQNDLIKSDNIQFLNEDYLQFVQNQLGLM
jgi:hypothetical protein